MPNLPHTDFTSQTDTYIMILSTSNAEAFKREMENYPGYRVSLGVSGLVLNFHEDPPVMVGFGDFVVHDGNGGYKVVRAEHFKAYNSTPQVSGPITTFLQERCRVTPGSSCRASHLYRAYRQWVKGEPLTAQAFNKILVSGGLRRIKRDGHAHWRDVVLKETSDLCA